MARRSYKNAPSKKSFGRKASTGKSAGGKKKSSKRPSAGRPSAGPDADASPASGDKPKRPARRSAVTAKAASPQAGSTSAAKPSAASTRDKPQRLQRLLAAAGYGSRRQCESMIEEGRVDVDGKVVSELGTVVDPQTSKVRVDGVPLRQQKLVYYVVNKPTGYLSTNADPRGRQRVIDLVPNSERVFPVGRLDQSSQGLMLLTNDGDLAQQLAHPKYGIRKVYRVTVAGKIDGETMRSMRKGIYISDGFVRVEGAKILKTRGRATELEITLREGKNREIRRILARLGHKVQILRRIAIGPLRMGDLPVGAHRALTREEVRRLRTAIEHSRDEVENESSRRVPTGGGTKKKRSGKKKSAGNRRRPEGRSDVMARRTQRKPTTTKFSFKPKKADEGGGSVIGGD
ncbi:MAG: pseudouridine synthase [Planctomycetales bacterium]|nr:pseudouridine synthase [Planctomycetales bacterium]